MKAFSKLKSSTLEFTDQMPCGQSLGQSVQWIVQTRPSDILWLQEQGFAKFSPEVLREVTRILSYVLPSQLEEQDIP